MCESSNIMPFRGVSKTLSPHIPDGTQKKSGPGTEVGRMVAGRRRYARILGLVRTRHERFDTNLCQIGESPTLPEGMPVGGGLVSRWASGS